MLFDDFRPYSFFFNEFYGGQEEIVKEAPFVAIEIVHQRNYLGAV